MGGLSAVMGALYALLERDLKKLLAYSTVENVGIVALGLGLSIVFRASGLGGLATLENANEETAKVEVVDRDDLWDREPQLLEEARRIMGRLPFEAIDVLIVGECGKNYSGAGIDPNVVGRMLLEASPEAETNNPLRRRQRTVPFHP